jgi:hypothetical protein
VSSTYAHLVAHYHLGLGKLYRCTGWCEQAREWRVRAVDGRVVGSQYDRTGNAFEIVQLDIESGTVTRLVDGVRSGKVVRDAADTS